jgi:hypothetical protein
LIIVVVAATASELRFDDASRLLFMDGTAIIYLVVVVAVLIVMSVLPEVTSAITRCTTQAVQSKYYAWTLLSMRQRCRRLIMYYEFGPPFSAFCTS